MSRSEQRRVLLILPERLLKQADEAAEALLISRLDFIRQSIARNIASFQQCERAWFSYCGKDTGRT